MKQFNYYDYLAYKKIKNQEADVVYKKKDKKIFS